ncbi:MAG TPA: ABC transporter permease [Gemmatimonadales bacterium]|nr:ABC transporter permease [Gemmatimonadales bacterium]
MSLLDGLRHRLGVWFGQGRHARELEEEFEFHRALEARQQSRTSLSPDDAEWAARRRFGNPTWLLEETRQMAGLNWLDATRQDLTFALRSFRRSPGFTTVVILTLAVGLGANTAIFSAVDAMLLRPLPYAAPDRLLDVSLTVPPRYGEPARDRVPWSYPKFAAFVATQRPFSDIGVYASLEVTLRADGEAERIASEVANGGYLRTLGVTPTLGRNIQPDEEQAPGAAKVTLISDRLWQRRFNADPAVLGRTINLGGDGYTVIGVLPRGFLGMSGRADIITSLLSSPPADLNEPWSHFLRMVGRLKPGVTIDQARTQVAEAGVVVDRTYPHPEIKNEHWGTMIRPLDATRVDPLVRQSLLILLGAVAMVLLIACANVANLFLIRAAGRRREIAVRLAVGAGRQRLIRQLVTEALFLSFAGGVAGLLLAWWGVHLLSSFDPALTLHASDAGIGSVNFRGIRLDASAFGFAALATIATGILFGLAPALHATRPVLTDALKEGAGHSGERRRRLSGRNLLAIGEVSLALVLLAGSGLMLRSLSQLLATDPGIDARQVLTLRLNTGEGQSRDSLPAFYDALAARVGRVPGLSGVALTDCAPLSGGCNGTIIDFRDRPPVEAGHESVIGVHWITPAWPTLMGVPLIRGRLFDSGDRLGTRKVVLINRAAAEKFWPGEDPLGHPVGIGQGGFGDTAYVVGVIGDVRYVSMEAPPEPDAYISYYQSPVRRMMLFARSSTANPGALAEPIRAVLKALAPDNPLYDVRPMAERVADALAYARFSTLVLSLFAAAALALATLGSYGVIAFGVSQRTHEIGVRMALGAGQGDVIRLVLTQGVLIAVVGGGVGLIAAAATTRVLGSLLYRVAPSDPATFAVMIAVLSGAVLLASWLPARRAASTPPTEALREP